MLNLTNGIFFSPYKCYYRGIVNVPVPFFNVLKIDRNLKF